MDETFLACLTPPGSGALATLALRGPRAWELACRFFRPALPDQPEPGRFWYGRCGAEAVDDVVLAVKAASPVPHVEIHCHGGREVVRMLTELFAGQGATVCPWPEFLARGIDPHQAAALAALAEAPTVRTASILLDQYHGAAGDDRDPTRYAAVGRHLTRPWRVVVAGPPNVGKSSLVNALAGYARCVVSPVPGTTRDVVRTLLALDGWPVEVADTAGLHDPADDLERQGMALAQTEAAAADLCLWLLDASAEPAWPPFRLPSLRYVVTKTDLPAAWDLDQVPEAPRVSATTGAGIDALGHAIASWLVPDPPPPGAAVPFR